ncbi:MAG: hypothetical protein R3C14_39180 [Caldilineaceae bacterium]
MNAYKWFATVVMLALVLVFISSTTAMAQSNVFLPTITNGTNSVLEETALALEDQHSQSVSASSAQAAPDYIVSNVDDLYATVNNPANAFSTVHLEPGLYTLYDNGINEGRLELQEGMFLTGDAAWVLGEQNELVYRVAGPVIYAGDLQLLRPPGEAQELNDQYQAGIVVINGGGADGITVDGGTRPGFDINSTGTVMNCVSINHRITDPDVLAAYFGQDFGAYGIVLRPTADATTVSATVTGNYLSNNRQGFGVTPQYYQTALSRTTLKASLRNNAFVNNTDVGLAAWIIGGSNDSDIDVTMHNNLISGGIRGIWMASFAGSGTHITVHSLQDILEGSFHGVRIDAQLPGDKMAYFGRNVTMKSHKDRAYQVIAYPETEVRLHLSHVDATASDIEGGNFLGRSLDGGALRISGSATAFAQSNSGLMLTNDSNPKFNGPEQ